MNKQLKLIPLIFILALSVIPIPFAFADTLLYSSTSGGDVMNIGPGVDYSYSSPPVQGNGQYLSHIIWEIKNDSVTESGQIHAFVMTNVTGNGTRIENSTNTFDITGTADERNATFYFSNTILLQAGVNYYFCWGVNSTLGSQIMGMALGAQTGAYVKGGLSSAWSSTTNILNGWVYTSDTYNTSYSTNAITLDEYWQFSNTTAVPRYTTSITNASWISTLIQEDSHTYLGHVWNNTVPYSDGDWYAYKSTNHFDNESAINIVDSELTLYDSGSISNGFFMFTYEPTDIDGDDYWEGWIINGTLDDNDGSFTSTFVTKADNPVTVPNPLPTDGSYTYDSTNDLIDTFSGYLIPLLTFLLPALILGWFTRWQKWPILIGLGIGSGLTYLFLGTQYLWLVMLVVIGIGASAYQSSRGTG